MRLTDFVNNYLSIISKANFCCDFPNLKVLLCRIAAQFDIVSMNKS